MQRSKKHKGFTLVELIIALIVTAIIMTAVATLSFAMGSANDRSSESFRQQAQLRYSMLRLPGLLKSAKLIVATPGDDIVIWKADNNPANNEIDLVEIAYIEMGPERNYIKLLELTGSSAADEVWFQGQSSQISYLAQETTKNTLTNMCDYSEIAIIPECSNAALTLDTAAPQTKFVNISFNVYEENRLINYQINGYLRCWSGYLLNSMGTGLVSDDD